MTSLYGGGVGVLCVVQGGYGCLLGYVVIVCWFPLGTILAVFVGSVESVLYSWVLLSTWVRIKGVLLFFFFFGWCCVICFYGCDYSKFMFLALLFIVCIVCFLCLCKLFLVLYWFEFLCFCEVDFGLAKFIFEVYVVYITCVCSRY